jgi:hypothetical protein
LNFCAHRRARHRAGDPAAINPNNARFQAAKSDRAMRQPPQAVPTHRDPLGNDYQSFRLNALYCRRKTLDQTSQRGPARAFVAKNAFELEKLGS